MEIKERYQYFLDPKTLLKAFSDRDYHLEKYKFTGASNVEVLECLQDGEAFRIKTRRTEKINVPKLASGILSETIVIVQTDEWTPKGNNEIAGNYQLAIEGTPMATQGNMIIRPHASGSELEVSIVAIVKIPLIGKTLATFLVSDIKKSLAREYEFEMEYLKRWLPQN